MKQLLQTLTPAESLLLRNGDSTPQYVMLKLTLMDLLLKKVLMVSTVERQPNSRDPVKAYQYVSAGENFGNYAALKHELTYLHDFRQSRDLQMTFKNCVKVAFENSGSEKKMRQTVRSTPALAGAFADTWLLRLTGTFNYSDQGFKKRLQLEDEIRAMEEKISTLLESDRQAALDELRKIGGNIFLLTGLSIKLLTEVEEAFLKNVPGHNSASGCSGGCSAPSSYTNDFDSAYPSGSDSADSGCSGDGGCSSGCGGCGD
ncbi:MAG TPA: hypothetical protein VGD65_07995 [Chryseosolibacter sp.]